MLQDTAPVAASRVVASLDFVPAPKRKCHRGRGTRHAYLGGGCGRVAHVCVLHGRFRRGGSAARTCTRVGGLGRGYTRVRMCVRGAWGRCTRKRVHVCVHCVCVGCACTCTRVYTRRACAWGCARRVRVRSCVCAHAGVPTRIGVCVHARVRACACACRSGGGGCHKDTYRDVKPPGHTWSKKATRTHVRA